MDFKLELVVVPVADQDRAKDFYIDKLGWTLIVDHQASPDFRVIQVSPPGSACAIALMKNPEAAGSVQGLHLVVADIEAAAAELEQAGIDTSSMFHYGPSGQTPGIDPGRQSYATFLPFSDPDGTAWLVQEVRP